MALKNRFIDHSLWPLDPRPRPVSRKISEEGG